VLRRGIIVAAFGAALMMPFGACAQTAMNFDGARAWTDLQRQVGFGPRPSGSPALAKTRQYILDQLEASGIRRQEQPFTAATPAGPVAMVNVIGTIPGRRAERIVLASHYDTKRAPFRFVGANDGASSTAALLELGRSLAKSRPIFTIELLFFDGEEAVNWDWAGTDNTYGSRHYVQAAQKAGTLGSIKALVLLDMIGDRDLQIVREGYSTPWLVDIIWSAAARLGKRGNFTNEVLAVEDDHLNFVRAGVPSVDVIDMDNPTWHTAQDDLEHVSRESLQTVGDVILEALPDIQKRLQ
jgi:glutaminyl-peptide cyclotransferase